MPTNRIEELKRQRQQEIKRKKSQLPYAIVLTIIVIAIYLSMLYFNFRYSIYWILGILIGITLQRSKFCFAASFRDPILVGSTSLIRAIIIAFIISTIGFAIIQYEYVCNYGFSDVQSIPGQIAPAGLHTALGAVLFGIGMVIAGGCASGTLMRIGEGFQLQLVVLVGFIVGSLLGAKNFGFWDKLIISKSPTIYFPEYVGFPATVIFQVIILLILYFLADLYHKKNNIMSL